VAKLRLYDENENIFFCAVHTCSVVTAGYVVNCHIAVGNATNKA
jgi:hypothetical protein